MNYGLLFRALLICVPLAISGCGQDSGTDSGTPGEATGMPSNAEGVIVDNGPPLSDCGVGPC